jgi:hypothetical protein
VTVPNRTVTNKACRRHGWTVSLPTATNRARRDMCAGARCCVTCVALMQAPCCGGRVTFTTFLSRPVC